MTLFEEAQAMLGESIAKIGRHDLAAAIELIEEASKRFEAEYNALMLEITELEKPKPQNVREDTIRTCEVCGHYSMSAVCIRCSDTEYSRSELARQIDRNRV